MKSSNLPFAVAGRIEDSLYKMLLSKSHSPAYGFKMKDLLFVLTDSPTGMPKLLVMFKTGLVGFFIPTKAIKAGIQWRPDCEGNYKSQTTVELVDRTVRASIKLNKQELANHLYADVKKDVTK